jgi:glycosyltransferase involved in cell wall biosynthesis
VVAGPDPTLRILFASPAYWPAVAFGGPTWVARELTAGARRLGHDVEVVTTSLVAVTRPPQARLATRTELVDDVRVTYLATPLRYRWMGIPPTLPLWLRRSPRPDVVHVFGYRDVVTTLTAAWARRAGVPYVFEPLDMFLPRFRNVPLKRAFDRVLGRPVERGAALIVVNSELERSELVEAGVEPERIATRPNGFPESDGAVRTGSLRRLLGVGDAEPLLLNVGRITYKKGLDLLLEAIAPLPGARLALVGPDDGDGTLGRLTGQIERLGLGERVNILGPLDERRPQEIYAEADVFVLPSRNESFGMVAAEAAAAGTPVVVTDRCGVAELLRDRGALVVPCNVEAIRGAIRELLGNPALRRRLGEGGREVAREVSWPAVVRRQEEIYRQALARSA